MNPNAMRPRQIHIPLTAEETFRKREFEHYLKELGATKSEAMRAVSALPQHVMKALLPLHRRAAVAWRARHG